MRALSILACTLLGGAVTLGSPAALPQEASAERADPFASLTLPALTYRSRPASEWLERFLASGGTSREALWSLFWWDERSPEVVEALREELARQRRASESRDGSVSGWDTSAERTARREIDAILDHWQVPHECLSMEEYWDRTMKDEGCRDPADVFALPALLPDDDAVLLGRLSEGDPRSRIAAATTLVARQRAVRPAVRAIVRALHEEWGDSLAPSAGEASSDHLALLTTLGFTWAWRFAGSDASRAIAELLADPEEPEALKRFAVDVLRPGSSFSHWLRDDRDLPRVLADLACEGGALADAARRELFEAAGLGWWPVGTFPVDYGWRIGVDSLDRPLIEEQVARAVRALLATDLRARGVPLDEGVLRAFSRKGNSVGTTLEDRYDAQKLLEIWEAVRRSEPVLAVARPWLIEKLERPGLVGRKALRLLCRVGEHGPEVKTAYLRVLGELLEPRLLDEAGLEFVPCLSAHDDETLAMLTRVFEKTKHVELLGDALAAGGFLESSEDGGLGRAFAEYLDRERVDRWWLLYAVGYPGPCEILEDDDVEVRVGKLSINARYRRSCGEEQVEESAALWALLEAGDPGMDSVQGGWFDCAIQAVDELDLESERLAEWGIAALLDYGNEFGLHQDAIGDVLARRQLTRRQQAELCHVDVDYFLADHDWSELFARQGEAAIERIVDVRRDAYLRPGRLCDVLRITRPSALDVEYLRLALTQGLSRDRELALEILADFASLDTPTLREATLRCLTDCDDGVRAAAARAREARGW